MFLDEVKAEEGGAGAVCAVALLLSEEDELRGEIVAVLDDPARVSAAITRSLKKRGFTINAGSIRRHRRRADGTGCLCPL